MENLLEAWKEFRRGKRGKKDVQEFQADLMHEILHLHGELKAKIYKHGGYHHFKISDPKPRDIHKAEVRDRLLHHALYRQLYPFFDRTFTNDSYSCRMGKGTHKAMNQFRHFAYQISKNHTRTVWVLKCDIRKFFASTDHQILFSILERHIADQDIFWLLHEVVSGFCSCCQRFNAIHQQSPTGEYKCIHKGLPLGNLTSQLLVNIYMNEFDQYVKHKLKAKYYVRYADDFVLLSHDKTELEQTLRYIEVFLHDRLKLQLHPDKVFIKTFASGIDFLGWVHFSDHRVLRTSSKKRMFRRLQEKKGQEGEEATRQSYLGMLRHGNTRKLRQKI